MAIFESMMFLFPYGGICIHFLVGIILFLVGDGLYLQLPCCQFPVGRCVTSRLGEREFWCSQLVAGTICWQTCPEGDRKKTRYWSLTVKPLKIGPFAKMENSRNNHPCFLGAMLNFGGVVSFLGVFFSQPNWMNRLFDGLFLWGPLNKNTFIFQGVLGLQGWEASIWMEANHLWTSFPAGICLLGGRLSGAYLWRDFNTFANNQEWTLDQWNKTQKNTLTDFFFFGGGLYLHIPLLYSYIPSC